MAMQKRIRAKSSKKLAAAFVAGLLLAAPLASAGEAEAITKAEEAAKAWLALVDAGKYAESWEAAASLFKAAVPKASWGTAVAAARGPLGALKARKLRSATFTRSLPGAPEGEYVVIQYDAQFATRPAVETITPMRDKDGVWRVSGYYVR